MHDIKCVYMQNDKPLSYIYTYINYLYKVSVSIDTREHLASI